MPRELLNRIDPDKATTAQLYPVLISLLQEQRTANEKLAKLQTAFEQYKTDQKDMLETWTTAKYVLGFIKLLAAIGLPISAVLAIFGYVKQT